MTLPRLFSSMLGRVALLLIVGVLSAMTLTMYFAGSERREFVSRLRVAHTADRLEQLVLMLNEVPAARRPGLLEVTARSNLKAVLTNGPPPAGAREDGAMARALYARLGSGSSIASWIVSGDACAGVPGPIGSTAFGATPMCHVAQVRLRDGTPLRFIFWMSHNEHPMVAGADAQRQLAYVGFFLGCLVLLAYTVASLTTRPLTSLAAAAAELGRNIEHAPIPESGPLEVRHAIGAFNAMQAKIQRYVLERTQMLAAITHDLQTPLTRIRLRLEKVSDTVLRDKLIEDLVAMETMIRDGLDLARSVSSREPAQRMDFDSILDSVCSDAEDAGQDVRLEATTNAYVMTRPNDMRRCLTNLVDNAVKYGGCARVTPHLTDKSVVVDVRDKGPGIPPERLEAVFDPFIRLEGSRSRDTGGTGIGLTIARNIAEQHGGTLTLANHPGGGLVARLVLPLG